LPSDRPSERLRDLIVNCDRIAAYVRGLSEDDLARDRLRLDAIERCVERISEAAKKLSPFAEREMPGIPWGSIRAVGNVLRHQYDDVDPAVIIAIARNDVPMLRESALACLIRLG
jgi:uncharacterized protein with HEPN domain